MNTTAVSPVTAGAAGPLPFALPAEAAELLRACPRFTVPNSLDDLVTLAVRDAREGWHEVAYETPGKGRVRQFADRPRR